MNYLFQIFILVFFSLVSLRNVQACTSPTGVEGQIQWITASSRVMYCDGTTWKNTYNEVLATSCSDIGKLEYISGELLYCNGTNWVKTANNTLHAACSNSGQYYYSNVDKSYWFCNGSFLRKMAPDPVSCTGTPWGTVADGYSNTAYSSAAPSTQTCAQVSEVRTCNNGTMSGSFTQTTCNNPCNEGVFVNRPHGSSVTAYSSNTASGSTTCASLSQTRTCSNGTLSGSFTFNSCTHVGMIASGGSISDVTISGRRYRIHRFNSSGTFTVSSIGSLGGGVQFLVVGGGGGGGSLGTVGASGGGGGGQVVSTSTTVGQTSYGVTVAAGGGANATGGTSSVFGVSAVGGGRGGVYNGGAGGTGASGGGAGQCNGADLGGTATAGNRGGRSTCATYPCNGGGGGGGAGGAGAGVVGSSIGGNGGAGVANTITGVTLYYGGGGGGAASNSSGSCPGRTIGVGAGVHGGGNGGNFNTNNAGAGAANTGSGGGGGNAQPGGAGGSGVVIIRYPLEP